uniref:Uncharacterized protein n=1 Tax=Ciona intestinalis TaxID=7719 RepID=H2XMP4_CIOIN
MITKIQLPFSRSIKTSIVFEYDYKVIMCWFSGKNFRRIRNLQTDQS